MKTVVQRYDNLASILANRKSEYWLSCQNGHSPCSWGQHSIYQTEAITESRNIGYKIGHLTFIHKIRGKRRRVCNINREAGKDRQSSWCQTRPFTGAGSLPERKFISIFEFSCFRFGNELYWRYGNRHLFSGRT